MNCSTNLICCLLALLVFNNASAQTQIELIGVKEPITARVQITGVSSGVVLQLSQSPAALTACCRVYVKSTYDGGSRQAVLGEARVSDKVILFKPRYPFEPGVEYLVQFQADRQAEIVSQVVSLKKVKLKPTTVVSEIYPTAKLLPQNLLKFYLHFSAPMSQGECYKYIELRSADGKVLLHPFLEVEEELWDQSGKRLTLLLDPGRVKRGLVPREEDGGILKMNSQYELVIRSQWLDAIGTPLAKSFSKKFMVGPEDFMQPDPSNWRVLSPKSRTRDPLTFQMPEAVDHATFSRGVTIENSQGEIVRGDITFTENETHAHFRPLKPWRPGLYDVRINTLIEDLVGNSIQRPFELDRFDRVQTPAVNRRSITIEVE